MDDRPIQQLSCVKSSIVHLHCHYGHLGQAVNYLDDLPLPRARRSRIKAASPDHLYPLIVVEDDDERQPELVTTRATLRAMMNGGQEMRS